MGTGSGGGGGGGGGAGRGRGRERDETSRKKNTSIHRIFVMNGSDEVHQFHTQKQQQHSKSKQQWQHVALMIIKSTALKPAPSKFQLSGTR